MKKFTFLKLFFTALFAVVFATMNADESSTFTDKNLAVGEGELGWTSTKEASKFENSSYKRGVQYSKQGDFTLTSNKPLTQVTSVTVVASTNSNGNSLSVSVGNEAFENSKDIVSGTANANKEYTFTGNATDGTVEISIKHSKSSVWIKEIRITCAGGSTIIVTPPTFSLEEGTYRGAQILELTSENNDAIYYSLNGGDATKYEQPININETTTVSAYTEDENGNKSKEISKSYQILPPLPDNVIFYESFNKCQEGNGSWNSAGSSEEDGTSCDHEGWQLTKAYCALNCLKIGTGSDGGTAITPSISISGKVILTFLAHGWKGDKTELTVTVGNITSKTFSISGEENDEFGIYSIEFEAEGDIQIEFASTGGKQRFFLDEVTVEAVDEAATTGTFSIGAPGYSTYFTDKAFVMPEGVEGGIVTGAANGNLWVDYCYPARSIVPANTGLLLKGAAKTYTYDLSTETPDAPEVNYLKGSVNGGKTEGEDCLFYMLSYDQNHENLGFYWGAADGAAFESGAGKAYLALPQTVASQVRGFVLDGTTTGISGVTTEANNTPAAVYSLTGVRMGTSTDGLPAGIYIVNGKKVLVK